MPDFSEDNDEIRQFQEEYPEIYYGVVELLDGHHWSKEAQALINDYPEIYNPFKKMLEKDLNNKAVLEF